MSQISEISNSNIEDYKSYLDCLSKEIRKLADELESLMKAFNTTEFKHVLANAGDSCFKAHYHENEGDFETAASYLRCTQKDLSFAVEELRRRYSRPYQSSNQQRKLAGEDARKNVWRNPGRRRFISSNGEGRDYYFKCQARAEAEIFGLTPGKKPERIATFRNSNGGTTLIWSIVCFSVLVKAADYWLASDCTDFWNIPNNKSIPEGIRALLALTQISNMYVSRENFERLAGAIDEFLRTNDTSDFETNHWPAVKELLSSKPAYPAIGFSWSNSHWSSNFWDKPYDYDDFDDLDENENDDLDEWTVDLTKAKDVFAYLEDPRF